MMSSGDVPSNQELSTLEVPDKLKIIQGKESHDILEKQNSKSETEPIIEIPNDSLSEGSFTEGSRYEGEGFDSVASEIQLSNEALNSALNSETAEPFPAESTEILSTDLNLPVESSKSLTADLKNAPELPANPSPADLDGPGTLEPSWNDANTVAYDPSHLSDGRESTQSLCETQADAVHFGVPDQADINCDTVNLTEGLPLCSESIEECSASTSSPKVNSAIELLSAEIKVGKREAITKDLDDHSQLFHIDTLGNTADDIAAPSENAAKVDIEEEVIEEETCEEGISKPFSIDTRPQDIPVQSHEDIHKYDPVHIVRFFTPESEMANCPTGSKMWVGNLPIGYNDREELASIFGRYGDILDISFGKGKITGYSKIQFLTVEACANACKNEDRRLMKGGFKLGIFIFNKICRMIISEITS